MMNNVITGKEGTSKVSAIKKVNNRFSRKSSPVLDINKIYHGDVLSVLKTFPEESIDLLVTSPPYFNLRNYGIGSGALGNETDPREYATHISST